MSMLTKQLYATTGAMLLLSPFMSAQAAEDFYNVELEAGLLSSIQQALPEGQVAQQAYLDPSYDPVLRFSEDTQVAVTFIDEGAGYRNSLGYFTFDDDTFSGMSYSDLDSDSSGHISITELQSVSGVSTGMIFDNASKYRAGGSLLAGDTAVLGGGSVTNVNGTDFDMTGGIQFSAGTNMGFFLIQNAWDGREVNGWDNDEQPLAMYSVDFLNPENSSDAIYDSANSESRHVAMMFADESREELIMGFEDLHRTDSTQNAYGYRSDEDFNDAVFRIRTDPVSALFETNVPTTETVISMNTAPAPAVGGGALGGAILAAGLLLVRRRS